MLDEGTPKGSHFADRTAAQRALHIALPMIEPLVHDASVCGSGFLYIVAMDPALRPHENTFHQSILIEHAIGDRSRWDADYAAFAHAKADLAWRLQKDSHVIQALTPEKLRAGDTLLAGAVCLDGIVVAVSGAHPPWDIAIATTVAACLRAVASENFAAARAQGALTAGS